MAKAPGIAGSDLPFHNYICDHPINQKRYIPYHLPVARAPQIAGSDLPFHNYICDHPILNEILKCTTSPPLIGKSTSDSGVRSYQMLLFFFTMPSMIIPLRYLINWKFNNLFPHRGKDVTTYLKNSYLLLICLQCWAETLSSIEH